MKTSIKTTIGIIVIALSSISLAQARDHRSERDHDRSADRSHARSFDRGHSRSYEQPRHERRYRHNERRHHWKRFNHRSNHYRGHRRAHRSYYRKHHGYERHYRSHRRFSRHGYNRTTYVIPRHSDHALPVLAGTLIGSAIANDASNGDPAATLGGAVFGAIVGNALARH